MKKRYAVILAPATQLQARRISNWWRENRPSAPDLFDDEMAAALGRLADVPKTSPPYRTVRGRLIRRALMPRTFCHLYFEIHAERDLVHVVAVWHGARGRGPRL
jgi:plasmid stabilization system protein ParE